MKKLEKKDLIFDFSDFASNALDGKYILVVGSSAILKKELFNGDSTNMLFDMALKVESGDDEETLRFYREHYPSFTEWESATIQNDVSQVYNELLSLDLSNCIEPTLQNLMETRLFRIVLTTSVDPMIEKLMDGIWGKDNYDIILGPDDNQIKGDVLVQYKNIINRERPVLCYVLGRICEKPYPKHPYALTESEALNMMAKWLTTSTDGNSFMSSVRKKDCLHVSIGCKFDDWMFRFFWYLITGDAGSDKGIGQAVVDLETGHVEDPVNSSLSRYLIREKSSVYFDDSRDFMKAAVESIEEEKRKRLNDCETTIRAGHLFDDNRHSSVFLSYAHEDYSYVRRLYQMLREENFDVWMDEYVLEPGNDIKSVIKTAIRDRCNYYVPILTTVVWDILNDRKTKKRWVMKEWEMAKTTLEQKQKDEQESDFSIIPIVTCDFLNKDKGKKLYESFVHKCFLPKMNKDGKQEYPEVKYCEGITEFVDHIKIKGKDE